MTDAERDAAVAAAGSLLLETQAEADSLAQAGPDQNAVSPLIVLKIGSIAELLEKSLEESALGSSFSKLLKEVPTLAASRSTLRESLTVLEQVLKALEAARQSRPEVNSQIVGRPSDPGDGKSSEDEELGGGGGPPADGGSGRSTGSGGPPGGGGGSTARISDLAEDALAKRALDNLAGSPVAKLSGTLLSIGLLGVIGVLVVAIGFAALGTFRVKETTVEILENLRQAAEDGKNNISQAQSQAEQKANNLMDELNAFKDNAVHEIVQKIKGRTRDLESQISDDEKQVATFQPRIDRLQVIAEDIRQADAAGGVANFAAKAKTAAADAVLYRDSVFNTLKDINGQLVEKYRRLIEVESRLSELEKNARDIDAAASKIEKINETANTIDRIGPGVFDQYVKQAQQYVTQAGDAATNAKLYRDQVNSGLLSLSTMIPEANYTLGTVSQQIADLQRNITSESAKVCSDASPEVQLACLKGWMAKLEGQLVRPGSAPACEASVPKNDTELLPEEWLAIQHALQKAVGYSLALDGNAGGPDSPRSKTRAAIRTWHGAKSPGQVASSVLSPGEVCTLISDWQKGESHPATGILSLAERRYLHKTFLVSPPPRAVSRPPRSARR